jgi:hypothetical protein
VNVKNELEELETEEIAAFFKILSRKFSFPFHGDNERLELVMFNFTWRETIHLSANFV